MNQRNFLRILVVAAILLILPLAAFNPSAHAAFNFTTVNVPGADHTRIHDINDSGMVVGFYTSGSNWYGFTFDGSTYTTYMMPGAASTRFIGINNYGDIVGEFNGGQTDWTGLKYDGNTWISFVVPDAARTDPTDINNSGIIVGWNRDEAYIRAHGFIYDGLTFTAIDYPGGIDTSPMGNNDAGKVVGSYNLNGIHHAFVYDGSYSTIDYPGSSNTYGSGINNLDQIVGTFKDSSSILKGFLHDNGTWTEIFIVGSTYTRPTNINNNGVIVGYYDDAGTLRGFIATPSEPATTNIPKTGQTTSYSPGDDGALETGVSWPMTGNMVSGRFNDNNDGTVTDLLTGLIWTKNANNGPSTFIAARDATASLVLGACGAGEWRIPNMLELESLTHAGEADTSAWLNLEGFQNVQAAEYWSNNAYSLSATGWTINLGTDQSNYWMSWNTATRHHWPVCGGANGSPDPTYPANIRKTGQTTPIETGDDGDLEWGVNWPSMRFTDNLDSTMTDNLTGLMWTQHGGYETSMTPAPDGEILTYSGAQSFVDAMNNGQGLCVRPAIAQDCARAPNPPNDPPTEPCPADRTCVSSNAPYFEECRDAQQIYCTSDDDCIEGGICVLIPNYGHTDWRIPNKKEMLSLTHWEDEFSTDDLAAAGFTIPNFAWCSHWTSTTDPADTNRIFGIPLNTAGQQMLTFPLSVSGSCNWTYIPKFVWPVRTAAPSAPSISVTPSTHDFGDVVQGSDADVTITIDNTGNSDLSLVMIAQNDTIDPPFSVVSGQNNCSGAIVAPGANCTFDVRFSPIGRGGYNDTFDIESNDPDSSAYIVSVTGNGTTAYLIELPRTGQVSSYDAGDDGDMQTGASWPIAGNMGAGRFNDNNDGTVTDLLTGLIWTKNANNGPSTFISARDSAASLVLGTCGAGDWRIPNMLELESLTHAGEADTAAWLNSEGFQNVQAAEYWSNNAYSLSATGWTINLGTDQSNYWMSWTTDTRYFWPVCDGANGVPDLSYPANIRKTGQTTPIETGDDGNLEWGVDWPTLRFTDNLDSTMTDNLTGLMWTQSASPFSDTGTSGEILSFANALGFVNAINNQESVCRVDPAQRKQCFPWGGQSLPQTLCPTDYLCVGAQLNPVNQYGDCYGPGLVYCTVDADCNTVENEECVQLSNYGYTDWKLANKKEMLSLTHWEDEFSTDDLATAGFSVVDFAWCSHWTSTTDPADTSRVFGIPLNTAGQQMLTFPLSVSGGCNWTYIPKFVWPVRTAPAPSPDPNISITPSSFDFGNVIVGVTSNTVFSVENLGAGDLDITSVSIPSSDFSVQSEDCTTLSPLAQNATCSISVDFTPSESGAAGADLSIDSDDPDTPVLTANVSGNGITIQIIDLELSKTVDNPTPDVGSTVLFTVVVTNNGPADATGVAVQDILPNGYSNIQNISHGGTEAAGIITWSGLSIVNGAAVNLSFNADVNTSGNYLNVAQVILADQPDSDSTPDNDDGDQSEDDEDNAIIVLPGTSYSILNQPRTNPGDPYPCNLWYSWCDPARGGSWPSNAVYAASWDDFDITGGYSYALAEHFNVKVETTITEIKIWGGYWWQDIAPATDNFTLIFHNDAGGTIGTMVSEPAYTLNRFDTGIHVPMPYSPTQSGNSLIFEYTFTLAETLTLAPGTYWVEIFNDTTGHTNNNDFFWMWGYRDNIDGRGIDGLAWTGQFNAGGSGTSWNIDTEGNLAIEINGQAAGTGCTLRVKNMDKPAEYCTIQEAYTDAGDGDTILVKSESFTETLDFSIDKSVTITGGYDSNYSLDNGNTTIIGNVTSSNGSVTMGNFILQ